MQGAANRRVPDGRPPTRIGRSVRRAGPSGGRVTSATAPSQVSSSKRPGLPAWKTKLPMPNRSGRPRWNATPCISGTPCPTNTSAPASTQSRARVSIQSGTRVQSGSQWWLWAQAITAPPKARAVRIASSTRARSSASGARRSAVAVPRTTVVP